MSSAPRTFHDTDSVYNLPNDDEEKLRLDQQGNAIITMMGGTVWHSPLSSPSSIMDVGCGTGLNTMRLARAFPEAIVYGVDLSQVPVFKNQPENVQYIQGDFLKLAGTDHPLFQNGSLDLITHRMLVIAIPDWSGYIRSCFELLKPGGYLEMQEYNWRHFDRNNNEISSHWPWNQALRTVCLKKGIDLYCNENFAPLMREVGFEDVEDKEYKWTWTEKDWKDFPNSHDIGQHSVQVLRLTMGDYVERMLGLDGGYDERKIQELKKDALNTLADLPIGSHTKFRVVLGRKP